MRPHCSKMIIENYFEPCVLFLLLKKASYGYELKNNLDQYCSCQVNIGNLYRGLARLQKLGYVTQKKSESKVGPVRNIYELTSSGKKLLKEWIGELETGIETIQKLITNFKKYEKSH